MAVAYRDVLYTDCSSGGTTASPTVNKPTGTLENDVMLFAITTDNTHTIGASPTLNGFTQIGTKQDASTDSSTSLFYKIAGAAEAASWTFTNLFTAADNCAAVVVSYSGVDTAAPINQSSQKGNTATTAHTTTAITPSVNDCMIVAVYGADPPTGAPPTQSGTPDASPAATERHDNHVSGYGFLYVEEFLQGTAASVSLDMTSSASESTAGFLVALKPSGGGTTYTKTNIGILGLTGAGADATTFVEAGLGAIALTGSGADAMTFVETGSGIMPLTGSGADFVTFVETGMAILGLTGSGVANLSGGTTFTKDGAAILGLTGDGTNVVTYVEAGMGVLNLTGSGAREGGTVSAVVTYDQVREQWTVIYYYNT